jgi:general stress protein YciG
MAQAKRKKIDPTVREFLARAGRKGGKSTSEAKRAASAENGKKGGRPRMMREQRRGSN